MKLNSTIFFSLFFFSLNSKAQTAIHLNPLPVAFYESENVIIPDPQYQNYKLFAEDSSYCRVYRKNEQWILYPKYNYKKNHDSCRLVLVKKKKLKKFSVPLSWIPKSWFELNLKSRMTPKELLSIDSLRIICRNPSIGKDVKLIRSRIILVPKKGNLEEMMLDNHSMSRLKGWFAKCSPGDLLIVEGMRCKTSHGDWAPEAQIIQIINESESAGHLQTYHFPYIIKGKLRQGTHLLDYVFPRDIYQRLPPDSLKEGIWYYYDRINYRDSADMPLMSYEYKNGKMLQYSEYEVKNAKIRMILKNDSFMSIYHDNGKLMHEGKVIQEGPCESIYKFDYIPNRHDSSKVQNQVLLSISDTYFPVGEWNSYDSLGKKIMKSFWIKEEFQDWSDRTDPGECCIDYHTYKIICREYVLIDAKKKK